MSFSLPILLSTPIAIPRLGGKSEIGINNKKPIKKKEFSLGLTKTCLDSTEI